MSSDRHCWCVKDHEETRIFYTNTNNMVDAAKAYAAMIGQQQSSSTLDISYVGTAHHQQFLIPLKTLRDLCLEFDWTSGQHLEDPWEGLAIWRWIAGKFDIPVDEDKYLAVLFDTKRQLCPGCCPPHPEDHKCMGHGCQCLHCNAETLTCQTPNKPNSTD